MTELCPLFHALLPPLPLWKFIYRRLSSASFCHLVRFFHDECSLGRVVYAEDIADADPRGLLPPAVGVWLFHPDAGILLEFVRAAEGDCTAGSRGQEQLDVESFSTFNSKRFCHAVQYFR
jgi:hypothetical protein